MPKTCYAFNYYTLCKKIEVKDSAIKFLKEQGILKTSVKCKCGCDLATIKQRTGTGYYYFRCAKCDSMTSIRLLLLILHLWWNWNMILPLTSLCRFCLQYTETFVYFNDVCKYGDVWIVVVFIECNSEARENIIAAVFLAGASVGCLAVLLGIYFVFVVVV